MRFVLILAAVVVTLAAADAQPDADRRFQALEERISRAEREAKDAEGQAARARSEADRAASVGSVLFLYGVFCALWAQNTGRSAWGWFFLGVLFSFITVIVLLVRNSDDRQRARRQRAEAA